MTHTTRFLVSATVGSLVVVGALPASAQQAPVRAAIASPMVRLSSSAAPGSISGVVRDEHGTPVPHVVVSALGAVTTVAVTDATGRFDFGSLTPGPYLIRAHLAGYAAPRAQMIQVKPSARAVSTIALRREGTAEVLAAGIVGGTPEPLITTETVAAGSSAVEDTAAASGKPAESDVSETAWRIRHARRTILKDATVPEMLLAADDGVTASGWLLGQLVGTPARVADFFVGAPISGQVNLLTSGSFDSPQQLFSSKTTARNIANVRIGAPAGADADWTVSGALTQADISSWVVAGAYSTRAAVTRHRYDVGLSYSTQRYDGGNPLALRGVTDGSRNVGTIFGYDTIALRSNTTLAVGAEYGRFDYLASRSLISPRA